MCVLFGQVKLGIAEGGLGSRNFRGGSHVLRGITGLAGGRFSDELLLLTSYWATVSFPDGRETYWYCVPPWSHRHRWEWDWSTILDQNCIEIVFAFWRLNLLPPIRDIFCAQINVNESLQSTSVCQKGRCSVCKRKWFVCKLYVCIPIVIYTCTTDYLLFTPMSVSNYMVSQNNYNNIITNDITA